MLNCYYAKIYMVCTYVLFSAHPFVIRILNQNSVRLTQCGVSKLYVYQYDTFTLNEGELYIAGNVPLTLVSHRFHGERVRSIEDFLTIVFISI